ncbi:MAG: hypothetical protein PHT12_05470 [Patescibacteria group bacterium]|nr:hypothetical protein [Patescibacteria group bacterium]
MTKEPGMFDDPVEALRSDLLDRIGDARLLLFRRDELELVRDLIVDPTKLANLRKNRITSVNRSGRSDAVSGLLADFVAGATDREASHLCATG